MCGTQTYKIGHPLRYPKTSNVSDFKLQASLNTQAALP